MAIWRTILGPLVWIVYFIPVTVLPWGLLGLYKLVVGIIEKCLKGANGVDKLYFLDSMDSMLALDLGEKKPQVNVGFVLIVQGIICVEEMREHFKSCFLNEDVNGYRYEKLYSHLEAHGGYVFRAAAETLDIKEHVVEAEPISSFKLKEFITKFELHEWKSLKPCWKLAVIPLDDGKRTGIAFKIHHALADQYSLLHVLDKLTGSMSPPLVKAFEQSGLTQLRQIVEGPLLLSKMKGMEASKNPFRATLNPEQKTSESLVSFASVKLEELERLCEKYKVKMYSVLLTVISGALRKFLEEEGNDTIGEEFCVQVSFPLPKHPAHQTQTSNKNRLCNHWVGNNPKIPLLEPNPELRVKAIAAQLHWWQVELGHDMFFGRVMLPMIWGMPRWFAEFSGGEGSEVAATLSSLVGAEKGYSLLGKVVTNVHFWSESRGSKGSKASTAFSCHSFSHRGRMDLTLCGHSRFFKDQERFNHLCHKLIPDELNEFLRMSMGKECSSDFKSSFERVLVEPTILPSSTNPQLRDSTLSAIPQQSRIYSSPIPQHSQRQVSTASAIPQYPQHSEFPQYPPYSQCPQFSPYPQYSQFQQNPQFYNAIIQYPQ